jgi:hypothetical protein
MKNSPDPGRIEASGRKSARPRLGCDFVNIDAARLFAEALAIFEKLKSPYAEIARRDLERVKGKQSQ